ncbi:insulinase family protein [Salinarimonas chemoclinalis]|uniref:insulinase family protein n=1 Tax=Salinarimonas chemoclinalis TaxID=3241599 RepID=UPI0035569FF9
MRRPTILSRPRPRSVLAGLCALAALALAQAAAASEPVSRTTGAGIPYIHVDLPDAPYGTIVLAWPNTHALRSPGREGLISLGPQHMGARIDGAPARALGERLDDARQGFVLTNTLHDTRLALLSQQVGGEAYRPAARIAADLLVRADLDADDLGRLARTMLDNLVATERNPGFMAERALGAFVGGGDRRLSALTNRPTSTVEDVTAQDVAAWRAAVFDRRPVVVAAGPQPQAAIAGAIDTVLEALPAESVPSPEPVPVAWHNLGDTVVVDAPEAAQAIVIAAIPTAAHHLHDRLLVSALAGGPGSLLFEALRSRIGAAYDVGVRVYAITPDQALVGFGAAVPPDRAAEVATTMRETLVSLADGLPDGAFARTRDREFAVLSQAASDPNAWAQAVLARRAEGLDGGLDAMIEALEGLASDALDAYVSATFATPVTVAVVTPRPEAFSARCVVDLPEDAAGC